MNINEVLTYISTQASQQELAKIANAYKFRQDAIRWLVRAQFHRGDTVTWQNSRTRSQMSGTVAKINRKTIDVRTAQGLWRVSANLLKRG